jgi:hypothetical protein
MPSVLLHPLLRSHGVFQPMGVPRVPPIHSCHLFPHAFLLDLFLGFYSLLLFFVINFNIISVHSLSSTSAKSSPVSELNKVQWFYAPSAMLASLAKQSRICWASIKKLSLHRGTQGSANVSMLYGGSRGNVGP